MATLTASDGVFLIEALGTGETSPTIGPIPNASFGTFTAVSGGGTGFNSQTVTIEGSITGDAGTFVPLKDTLGTVISFSAAAHVEVSTAMRYFRAVGASGLGDVDIAARFK